MSISATLTFTSTDNQKYLEVLLLIVFVGTLLHAIIAFATVCTWKKWPLIVLNVATSIISVIMLIMNSNTDKDAKDKKVAVSWQWKLALGISLLLTAIANVVLVPSGQNWRCKKSDALVCTNKNNLPALQSSVRKYFNAELDEKKPLKGLGSRPVDITDLKDDKLEDAVIDYIDVDTDGNEILDCKGFKAKVDVLTKQILSEKKKVLRAEKRKQRGVSFEVSKVPQAPPMAGQAKYIGGGQFGLGAQKVVGRQPGQIPLAQPVQPEPQSLSLAAKLRQKGASLKPVEVAKQKMD